MNTLHVCIGGPFDGQLLRLSHAKSGTLPFTVPDPDFGVWKGRYVYVDNSLIRTGRSKPSYVGIYWEGNTY